MCGKYKRKGALLHDPDLSGLELSLDVVQLFLSRIPHVRISKNHRRHADSRYDHLPNPKPQFSAGLDLLISHKSNLLSIKVTAICARNIKRRDHNGPLRPFDPSFLRFICPYLGLRTPLLNALLAVGTHPIVGFSPNLKRVHLLAALTLIEVAPFFSLNLHK